MKTRKMYGNAFQQKTVYVEVEFLYCATELIESCLPASYHRLLDYVIVHRTKCRKKNTFLYYTEDREHNEYCASLLPDVVATSFDISVPCSNENMHGRLL